MVSSTNKRALGGFRSEEVEVTPSMARDWLKLSKGNRSLSHSRVLMMAAAMKRREWKRNGHAIKFDLSGALVDGHTRLEACALAGVSFITVVQWGVETVDEADKGRVRSLGYQLFHDGLATNASHGSKMAAIVRQLATHCGGIQTPISDAEAKRIVARYGCHLSYVADIARRKVQGVPSGWKLSSTAAAAVIYLDAADDQATQFVHQVHTGENLASGDPAMALRRWLATTAAMGGGRKVVDDVTVFWVACRAARAHYESEPLVRVTTNSIRHETGGGFFSGDQAAWRRVVGIERQGGFKPAAGDIYGKGILKLVDDEEEK